MPFFIKLLLIFLLNKILFSNQINYTRIFEETMLNYDIKFDEMRNYKSGAICIPDNNDVYDKYAIGFSYNMYNKSDANKVALSGCREMKKKLISYECKCEIIL
ncbi:MAG: hypothetical protein CMJ13_03125 [Pelagibacterales bacterium]|nr:hypothetical protein [Pelagibacterales bacterium]|tara:strand:- start:2012 stop:2320 length:309 start_codon:yes stop_codon:yes gene_type:complete